MLSIITLHTESYIIAIKNTYVLRIRSTDLDGGVRIIN